MSKMAEKVKRFFDMGLYSISQVETFRDKKIITDEEYQLITGGIQGAQ